jgi:hypothetical protein
MRTTIFTGLLAGRAVTGSILPRQEYGSALPSVVYVTQYSAVYPQSCNAALASTSLQATEVSSAASSSQFQQYGSGLPGSAPSSSIVPSLATSVSPAQSGWGWPNTTVATTTAYLPSYSASISDTLRPLLSTSLISSSVVLPSSSAAATTALASLEAARYDPWAKVSAILSIVGHASNVAGAPASSSVALSPSSAYISWSPVPLPTSSVPPTPVSSMATTTTTMASARNPFWGAASIIKSIAGLASSVKSDRPNYSGLTSYSGNPLEGRITLTLSTPPAIPASSMTFIPSSSAAKASSTAIVVVPVTPSSTAIVVQPVGTPSRSIDFISFTISFSRRHSQLPRALLVDDVDLPSFVLARPTRAPRPTTTKTEADIEITQTSTTTIETTMTVKPSTTPATEGGDDVVTSVMTPDSRCPYPYPGLYCGETKTTLITKTKKTASAKPTCGYPGQDLLC